MDSRANLKAWLAISILFAVSHWGFQSAYGQPWDGNGVAGDPYQIWTPNDMQAIGADANYWDAHFELMADIDLGSYTGTSFNIIGNDVNAFAGVFDGNGHTIASFTYDSNEMDYVGLFGYVSGGKIMNLGLRDPSVNAGTGNGVGSLVGYVGGGTIIGCYVEGGSVSGVYGVGGLVGGSYDGEIVDCYSTGDIAGLGWLGGLTGSNGCSVRNCYSRADVTGGGDSVGGLTGGNLDTIENCYSTGVVTGQGWSVGGLVGNNDAGGEVINSYWDVESSGIDTSYGGIGLTTADMYNKHTFFLWGCDGGWTIDDGNDYPRLVWEGKVGEVIEGFGCGTEEEPYLLYGASSMYVIGVSQRNYDKHYELMVDIDMSGYIWRSHNIIGQYLDSYDNSPFTGVFDGGGHTISNFRCDANGVERIGLFGYIDGLNAEIKNVGLIDPNVEAGTGECVGGLIGFLAEGSVTGCCVKGGIVKGNRFVGGLVGWIERDGGISKCYSTAGVMGDYSVGGLVGYIFSGGITDCYATGTVTAASNGGGLIGRTYKGQFIKDSYWDVNSSGVTTQYVRGGIGLTTRQMQSKGTYLFWGCGEGAWTIDDGNDYPKLLWEGKVGEVIDLGCGTEEEPYLIYEATSMYVIGASYFCSIRNLDKHYRLMADIDMSEYTGASIYIIGIDDRIPFNGVFDGNSHAISNFTYESNGVDYIGLFGYVGEGAEIRDLMLIDPNVNAGDGSYVGALVGYSEGGSLSGCRVEGGNVSGGSRFVGGMVGSSDYGMLSNCGYEGSVRGEYGAVGGLVGYRVGEVLNCYSRGVVTGVQDVGGLVGHIRSCGSISNCFSESIVTGQEIIGGLIGYNSCGDISNCYSTGDVAGENDVGGLVGYNHGGSYTSCFWDNDVNPDVNGIGNGDDPNVTGKTTAEMQDANTFIGAGWDFNTPIWKFCSVPDYPRLEWEQCPGPGAPVLESEPDMTTGTTNTIFWGVVDDANDYFAECANDVNFAGVVYDSGWIMDTNYTFTGLEAGRRYWYNVKARRACGVESEWSNVESSLQVTLAEAVEVALDSNSLQNENMMNALLNKIDAAQAMIDDGRYQAALNKLENDILAKTDGCVESGEPDKNDWIITCEGQNEVYPLIMETIDYVMALME